MLGIDYAGAVAAKRGERALDPEFDRFATAFERSYRVVPLWFGLDTVFVGGKHRPRLIVIVERSHDALRFRKNGRRLSNFDSRKQRRVAALFVENVSWRRIRSLVRRRAAGSRSTFEDRLLVIFVGFEDHAIEMTHSKVNPAMLRSFGRSLGLGKELWRVASIGWSAPVVFMRTAEQAANHRNTSSEAQWSRAYFDIAKHFDEFGYLTLDHCRIVVDSKERFDTEYESNWYYYWL